MITEGHILFGTVSALLAVHIAWLIRENLSTLQVLLSRVRSAWRNGVGRSIMTVCAGSNDQQFHAFLSRRRLEHAKKGLVVMTTMGFFFGIVVLVLIARDRGRQHAAVAFSALYALVLASLFLRRLITVRVVEAIYSVLMLGIVLDAWYQSFAGVLFCHRYTVIIFLRLCFGMWVANARLAAFWNVMCLCPAIATSLSPGDFQPVAGEIFVTVLILILVCDRAWTVVAEARFEMKMRTSQNERFAATSLLNALCDVVVPLDDELKITEHVPRLAGMLLFNPSTHSNRGLELHKFMPSEEDRQQFLDFVRRPKPATEDSAWNSMAEVLCTQFKDSRGNAFEAELFHAQFWSPNHGQGHLIGIREVVGQFHPRGRAGSGGGGRAPRAEEDAESGTVDGLGSSESPSAPSSTQGHTVYAVFNALTPKFDFTYLSPAWVEAFGSGSSEGDGNLAGWMTEELMRDFRSWLQPHVNWALHCGGRPIGSFLFRSVESADPRTGNKVKALLSVKCLPPEGSAAPDVFLAKLMVVQVQA